MRKNAIEQSIFILKKCAQRSWRAFHNFKIDASILGVHFTTMKSLPKVFGMHFTIVNLLPDIHDVDFKTCKCTPRSLASICKCS